MSTEQVLFVLFAVATVVSALGVIFFRNSISSAMALVGTFFFLAGVYVLLWAHTIAAIQVLVYAGAIMVLFLFVIMLLSTTGDGPVLTFTPFRMVGGLAALVLFGTLARIFWRLPAADLAWMDDPARRAAFGTIQQLGEVMYTRWLFPFESVSLLLLVAILGAVVVAKAKV
jgi:NADH-quinone oxidoreductase subunit J